jgi:acetoin utilization deacetylase AcuC-like enzyme
VSNFYLYYPFNHQSHFSPGHPEKPERIEAIRSGLIEAGLWDLFTPVPISMVSPGFLENIHRKEYLSLLQAKCAMGQWLDADTYTTPASWQVAIQTVKGTISTAEMVWENSGKGFVLARPPGHHAHRFGGMGFCLLNNIACAAEYLLQSGKVSRLAIIDLDLHHGNGTQDIFWQRGDVLFISVHQADIFPLSGRLEEIGEGPGKGTKVNVPLLRGSGDQAYRAITQELILPILSGYGPEIILVSYGFDPHWLDPLGSLNLSAMEYYNMMISLIKWANLHCDGKFMIVLEGGYDLTAAKICTQAVISALFDLKWTDPVGSSPYPETNDWQNILNKAKSIWKI